jgi:hypothetical protein
MWLVPTVVCCGTLTWASFLYVGIKTKRRSWLIAAACYGVAFVLYLALQSTAPTAADGTTDTSGALYSAGNLVFAGVWIGGAIHALAINREWLAFQASPQAIAPSSASSANATTAPWALDEPWRSFVTQALTLQREIATTVVNTPPGAMRDRLGTVTEHVDSGLVECRQLAQVGQGLARARGRIDTAAIARQLTQLPTGEALAANASLAQAVHALQAQLDTAKRIEDQVTSTYNGLVLLNAQLGEVNTRVIELSVRPDSLTEVAAIDTAIESVVTELVTIREALEEVDGYLPGP